MNLLHRRAEVTWPAI